MAFPSVNIERLPCNRCCDFCQGHSLLPAATSCTVLSIRTLPKCSWKCISIPPLIPTSPNCPTTCVCHIAADTACHIRDKARLQCAGDPGIFRDMQMLKKGQRCWSIVKVMCCTGQKMRASVRYDFLPHSKKNITFFQKISLHSIYLTALIVPVSYSKFLKERF